MTMLELLEESPIIAAIKSWEGLEKSLKSECKVVFVLFGTICDIDQIVARIKDAGKVAIVHVDMIQGLSSKGGGRFYRPQYAGGRYYQHKKYTGGTREGDGTLCDPENLCCGFDRTRYIEKTDRNVPTGCSRDHAGGDAEDS